MSKGKLVGRDFELLIEQANGSFTPICQQKVVPPSIPEGDIEITGTGKLSWVSGWKLMAWLRPPM